jgi:hypothetical protein
MRRVLAGRIGILLAVCPPLIRPLPEKPLDERRMNPDLSIGSA